MALTLRTQLPVEEAARRVTDAIVNGSFSAELVAQSDSRGRTARSASRCCSTSTSCAPATTARSA